MKMRVWRGARGGRQVAECSVSCCQTDTNGIGFHLGLLLPRKQSATRPVRGFLEEALHFLNRRFPILL